MEKKKHTHKKKIGDQGGRAWYGRSFFFLRFKNFLWDFCSPFMCRISEWSPASFHIFVLFKPISLSVPRLFPISLISIHQVNARTKSCELLLTNFEDCLFSEPEDQFIIQGEPYIGRRRFSNPVLHLPFFLTSHATAPLITKYLMILLTILDSQTLVEKQNLINRWFWSSCQAKMISFVENKIGKLDFKVNILNFILKNTNKFNLHILKIEALKSF